MVRIPLTQGKEALIDDEDFELVSKYRWYAMGAKRKTLWYAATATRGLDGRRKHLKMEVLIIGALLGLVIDHIDGDGLNNQKSNLRFATRAQNAWNSSLYTNNSSGYKGVSWNAKKKKWEAYIYVNGKTKYLGQYFSVVEAAEVYDKEASLYYGEFARLNLKRN